MSKSENWKGQIILLLIIKNKQQRFFYLDIFSSFMVTYTEISWEGWECFFGGGGKFLSKYPIDYLRILPQLHHETSGQEKIT